MLASVSSVSFRRASVLFLLSYSAPCVVTLQCTDGYSDAFLFPVYRGCIKCGVLQWAVPPVVFLIAALVAGVTLWLIRDSILGEQSPYLVPLLRNLFFSWQALSQMKCVLVVL